MQDFEIMVDNNKKQYVVGCIKVGPNWNVDGVEGRGASPLKVMSKFSLPTLLSILRTLKPPWWPALGIVFAALHQ